MGFRNIIIESPARGATAQRCLCHRASGAEFGKSLVRPFHRIGFTTAVGTKTTFL